MRSYTPHSAEHLDTPWPGYVDWFGLLRRGWWLVLLGTLVAIGLGYFATTRQAPVYLARATYLVMPSEGVVSSSNEAIINSINTLDRRTTMNTFAEIGTSPMVVRRALEQLGYPPGEADNIQVRAVVLPETFAVEVSVEATDPGKAAALANAIVLEAGELGARSYPIFQTRVLEAASPPPDPTRPQPPRDVALAGLAGLGLGLIAAYALEIVRQPLARRESLVAAETTARPPIGAQ